MNIVPFLTSVLIGYFMGNIMASYLVSKWVKGTDIRGRGSGNAGASNSVMVMGWKNGLIVMIVDVAKAFIAVYIIKILYWKSPDLLILMLIAGSMSVVGHIYPVFLKFKGGKGAACLYGMCLAINPVFGVCMIFATIVILFITKYIAMSSICMFVLLPVVIYFYPDLFFKSQNSYSLVNFIIGLFVAFLGIYNHKDNISNMNRRVEGIFFSNTPKKSK